ncbi:hypothetical protein ACFL3I_08880 [Pseudomonadota bacterium]
MGFKTAKSKLIRCLKTGRVLHEERNDIDVNNLLAIGLVTLEEAAYIIGSSRGDGYSVSPHHFDAEVDVHVIKTRFSVQAWYIKWYFLGPNSVFISFHM